MQTENSTSTPSSEGVPLRDDAHFASAYRDLEGDVCDIVGMALVLDTVMDDVSSARRPKGENYVEFLLTVDQETALVHAMTRMLADARELKATYFRAFGETA